MEIDDDLRFVFLLKEDLYSSWLQEKTKKQNISKFCFLFITVFAIMDLWHDF